MRFYKIIQASVGADPGARRGRFIAPTADLSALDGWSAIQLKKLMFINLQLGTRFQWPKRLSFRNLSGTLQDSFRCLAPLFCVRFLCANHRAFSLAQRPVNHAYQPFSLA
jgi:hypothetical protein